MNKIQDRIFHLKVTVDVLSHDVEHLAEQLERLEKMFQ